VTWLAAVVAMLGVALLAVHGAMLVASGVGPTLAAALFYALHIVLLGRWSRVGEAVALCTVQMLSCAAVCLLATWPYGSALPGDMASWAAIVYFALIAGAGAMWMQTWAQAYLSATCTAVIMA
jgi:drug/metabolite transporter (DMT)-like permease